MFKKIIVTGGNGRFGSILKNYKTRHKVFFPTKKELNILNEDQIKSSKRLACQTIVNGFVSVSWDKRKN